ncbi:flagellar export chaperone FliS [Woeseia oceani]|uniref:Flagellar secretion chaperone FliS n=2 Tax=Woeseia oceani TaxID=1548547 RepID=A0A193LKX9_9GAMM|nr:flagellar export chaperone FliS [Woeseia oceani]
MQNSGMTAMREYRQVGTRQAVESASPYRLVQLMMERALAKIAIARGHLERNAISEKGRHIGDAIGIISGLQASLNHKVDSDLSGNFDALYDYMSRRLLEANLKNDDQILQEVAGLMRQVKEAWDAIGDEIAEQPVAAGLA